MRTSGLGGNLRGAPLMKGYENHQWCLNKVKTNGHYESIILHMLNVLGNGSTYTKRCKLSYKTSIEWAGVLGDLFFLAIFF